jgi:hypothetical protein
MERRRAYLVGPMSLLVLLFGVPANATAQPKPITGKLDRPGYTVIALAAGGEARTVIAQDGSFSVEPPAATVSLHLRAPDGTYAGPVVLEDTTDRVAQAKRKVTRAKRNLKQANRAVKRTKRAAAGASGKQAKTKAAKRLKKARRSLRKATKRLKKARRRLRDARAWIALKPSVAVFGVKAGAALGQIAVNGAGFATARLGARAWDSGVAPSHAAQAVNGVPIGAGNFGLVRSTRTDGAGIGDTDLDAVPGPLDIDDDGDLVLDGYDSPARAGAAQAGGGFPDGGRMDVHPSLLVFDFPPVGPVNVNGGSSDAQIAEAQTLYGELTFFWFADNGSAELDCGSLIYCRAGGSGRIPPPQGSIFRSQGLPFPECCDGDGDGLGTLTQAGRAPGFGPGSGAMTLWHGATIDQIDSGDVLIARGTSNGVPFESAKTVGFVFSTPPVLAAYDDGQGNAATFTYPRPSPTPDTPVKAGPGGDLLLSLALWRPQRERLADEPGSGRWMDIGHLVYYVDVFVSATEGAFCPLGSLSTTDPELTPTQVTHSPGIEAGAFIDLAPDQPPNPVNTVAFTLNLTQCLASKGVTLDAGETARVNFHAVAVGAGGQRSETRSDVPFKRQP